MANQRLQSLLEANKRGLTLRYDPPASRNLCFYRCLSKFVDVKEKDIAIFWRIIGNLTLFNICSMKLAFRGKQESLLKKMYENIPQ